MTSKQTPVAVAALYKFVQLDDYINLKPAVLAELEKRSIRGTLLLAEEGINGTISGIETDLLDFLNWLQKDPRFSDLDYKLSYHENAPFYRTKVKLKKEIVTMGVDGIDPNKVVGTYVEAKDWNELISDPDVILIDTRNDYEVDIGTFEGALNPNTKNFRDFPDYVDENFGPETNKKIAMFCTGGIRCEKASAYMKEQGFDEVFHLKGGILKYLEKVDECESKWNGECFVFDDRVAVNHSLEKGQYDQCHACRHPITEQDKQSPHYVSGVSCHLCYDTLTEQQKSRFAEREKQVKLAAQRNEKHIGAESRFAAVKHRAKKQSEKNHQKNQKSL